MVAFSSARKPDRSDAANTNDTSNIWVVKADGTGLRPLTSATAARADSFYPQWSPDGTMVVFGSGRNIDLSDAANTNSTSNIWVVKADGTGLRPLTTATAEHADSCVKQWCPAPAPKR
ncbi:MAG: hypothetical protein WC690_10325 [bacterium]